jgi:hypothetical protein
LCGGIKYNRDDVAQAVREARSPPTTTRYILLRFVYDLCMNMPYTHIYARQIFFVWSWLQYLGRNSTFCHTCFGTSK